MYFLTEDDELLKKYKTIWDKVSADIKKEFDSEPVCNKKFLKPKIKVFLKECKYIEKKVIRHINDNLNDFSSFSSYSSSDEE